MTASRYLFVVKNPDSKSFSKSDVSESKSIHRHVQINSIRVKQASVQSKDEGFQRLPFIQVEPRIAGRSRPSSKHPALGLKSSSRGISSQERRNSRLVCRCILAPRGCPIHAIPHVPAYEEHVVDPFASTGVTIDRQAHSLLQYFIQVSHPRTWYSEVQKDRSYTFARDAQALVRESFEHEVHLYTLLASMASQMQHFDRLHQDESGTDALATKAIATVRRYLQTNPPIVQRLIFDIHQLAVIEFYRYQLKSARLHLSAAKALLPHIGGIENVDPSLREWIVIGDGFLSAELSAKPLFPASCFDPGDLSFDAQLVVTAGFVPGEFLQDPKYNDLISIEMMGILYDMVTVVLVHDQQSNKDASEKSPAILHWLHLRTTALRHRLLELDIRDDRVNAIRIALITWLFLVMTVTGRQRTCKVLSAKLRSSLHTTGRFSSWGGYEEILFWILLTGASCSNAGDRYWFLAATKQLQSHAGHIREAVRSPLGYTDFCKRFFYVEKVQQPMLQVCINELHTIEDLVVLNAL